MSSISYTAGEVMADAAALLNDTGRQIYTNANQLPYLKQAVRDLRERMQQSNLPVTNAVDVILFLPAGRTEISFVTTPPLPSDIIEIRQLWTRQYGQESYGWYPLRRVEFLPYQLEGQPVQFFGVWAWIGNKIHFLPSNQDNDIKMNYIKQLLQVVDQNSVIEVINGHSFLNYRTASLCARYIGEDVPRADMLDQEAQAALDTMVNIENKAKQAIYTRRRPFRMAWKNRGSLNRS